ncbi:hypothetical protein [Nocardioides caldifontis]|uniref:hypothetical protein n=1 Tax=Nocardioides caldifontis TaxID=2588938 RepID=UPI0011DFA109|nr:hypothetical protein [Nocardioides caldifontis]
MKPSTELALGRVRGLVPTALLPAFVEARTRLAWRRPEVREDARAQMRFVLEHTRPDVEIEGVALSYVRRQVWRGELRWHPELITDQPVEGIEHLVAARALGRGVVLSFMHHGHFEGALATIGRHGVPLHIVGYPQLLSSEAPGWMQQHARVAQSQGGVAVLSTAGAERFVELLTGGAVLALASDVAGSTPMRFLGRDLIGSFGAPRLAMGTGSPVVVMTSELKDGKPAMRIHEPFDPAEFPTPHKLLEAMLATHEPYLVRWPELYDLPTTHWGIPDPEVGA